jgi:tRNA dimethylallyltransferase
VKAMINNGWKKEVVELYKKDKALAKLNAFKAIGYPQVLDAVANNKEIDVETIKMNTRRYAKRQLTWIRHHYVGPIIFNQDNYQEVVNEVNEWMK